MVRVPYEDNKFVGSSVLLLVVIGFIMPISIATIFGFSPRVVLGPPYITQSPQEGQEDQGGQEGVTILPPPQYMVIGNGTAFDSLVNETTDRVAFTSEAPVVVDEYITITTAYPSDNITINGTEAIDIATNFIMSFDYMQGIMLNLSAYLADRIPCWIVNSQVEGGSVCIWINALSGIVCFYSLNVDLLQTEDTDLRLYFSDSGNISLEEAEMCAFDFLQQNHYSLLNGSRYNYPWYKPLPPGTINEGFVNGEYYFQIYGMSEDIFEPDNKVQLQIEASTGAVVYFSYLWTEHPDLPEVDIIALDAAENSAISCLRDHGILSPTIGYPILVLRANWYPDIGYSGSIYWQVAVEGEDVIQLHISPISGEVFGYVGILHEVVPTTSTTSTATAPGTSVASFALIPLGLTIILPLSSFSLGLAGYIIVKHRQTKGMYSRDE